MEILLQNSQDMQLQVIDELKETFQNTTYNLTQDYTGKFDENKAETQACINRLTSVEQVLEGVERVAVGNKNMILSVKNRINEKVSRAADCDTDWDRFLDHCYYFSTETKAWYEAMVFYQNIMVPCLRL